MKSVLIEGDRSLDSIEDRTGGRSIEIRPLRAVSEYQACVEMQMDIWGDTYGELVLPIILRIVQSVGGVAVGAFAEDGGLEGFVFGITGVSGGRLIHWSHILAVRPELRNSGLGRRLKEYQREMLRPLGVEAIRWTFDPLVAKNAHFNLNRLGAEVVEYVEEMYGSTGSILHALGTDRLIVEWPVDSPDGIATRRREVAEPKLLPEGGVAPVANLTETGEPIDPEAELPTSTMVKIAIPADLDELIESDLERAKWWQRTIRRTLPHYLDLGYRVLGLERRLDEGLALYHLMVDGE